MKIKGFFSKRVRFVVPSFLLENVSYEWDPVAGRGDAVVSTEWPKGHVQDDIQWAFQCPIVALNIALSSLYPSVTVSRLRMSNTAQLKVGDASITSSPIFSDDPVAYPDEEIDFYACIKAEERHWREFLSSPAVSKYLSIDWGRQPHKIRSPRPEGWRRK